LVLVIGCAGHAFLTRKLPENFNESWYIFVSVATTSFLWVVFLPTYFSMFEAYLQSALLAFCLFVNGTVTLFCLYLPKVYAIYFVDEDDILFGSMSTAKTTVGLSQVAPRSSSA